MSLVPEQLERYTYDHVPTLRELMPTNGGLPGVQYGLVCVHNQRHAQDAGWQGVEKAKVFTIASDQGSVDMILACQGTPVRGMSPDMGARKMFVDEDVYRLTGLWPSADTPKLEDAPQQTTPTSKKAKVTADDALKPEKISTAGVVKQG